MLLIPFLFEVVSEKYHASLKPENTHHDNWCPRRDSNPEPTDYESAALTVELQGHCFDRLTEVGSLYRGPHKT